MFRLAMLASVLLPALLHAEVFCVSSAVEFQAALNAARNNGESDEIRLQDGVYTPPSAQGFSFGLQENASTTISGGWSNVGPSECVIQTQGPTVTSIDGGDTRQLFKVSGALPETLGDLTIKNLSFRNGLGPPDSSQGAVHLGLPANDGRILIDRVLFSSNTGISGAALTALGMARLTVRNSVFQFNDVTQNQGVINVALNRDDQRFYFVNNTVIDNVNSNGESTRCSGLWVSAVTDNTSPDTLIANNIFWGNDAFDACMPARGDSYLLNNNIQDQYLSATVEIGNLSTNPLLAPQIIDYTPQPGSPMVNAGLNEPVQLLPDPDITEDWSHGNTDFDGGAFGRVVEGRVDIGAVESTFIDRIHCDRFHVELDCSN